MHVAQRARKVGRAERELAVKLGREPTLDEIADETGLPIEQVEEAAHQRARSRASTSRSARTATRRSAP